MCPRSLALGDRSLRTLVVDDSADDAELLLRALKREFSDVEARVVSCEVDLRTALTEVWDVVLSDYSMPSLDAFRVMEVCAELNVESPLIVVSGSISDDIAVACMKAGATDYLLKDRLSRLAPAVRQALEANELRRRHRFMQAEIELKQRELEQAVRLEAIGRFAAGVAHDFRNLLTAIFGASELLRDEEDVDRRRRMVGVIEQAAQRGASLTQHLLALGKRQELHPEPLEFGRLVADFNGVLRSVLGSRMQLVTTVDPALWFVYGDATQLTQILLNLVVNSRDAMKAGGTLSLRIYNSSALEHDASQPLVGDWVVIDVEDTGTGIAPENLPHIFEPFFTTKAEEGTGLGLSTTLGIVQQSGGSISASNRPGGGTLFRILLPRYIASPLPSARTSQATSRDVTLLVVENELVQLALIASLLEPLGYSVLQATSAATALEMLQKHAEVELAIVDIGLADANGRELVETMRRRKPALKALLISGHVGELKQADPGPGHTATLAKPFTQAALAGKVSALIAGELEITGTR